MRVSHTAPPHTSELLSVGDAARRLGLSASGVRHLEALGVLPATRTAGGLRLYRAEDVARVARERAAARRRDDGDA